MWSRGSEAHKDTEYLCWRLCPFLHSAEGGLWGCDSGDEAGQRSRWLCKIELDGAEIGRGGVSLATYVNLLLHEVFCLELNGILRVAYAYHTSCE